MKIRYDKLNVEYAVPKGVLNFLVIENEDMFDMFSSSLWHQYNNRIDGPIHVLQDNEVLDIHNVCCIVFTPNDCTFESTQYKKGLFQELISEMQAEDFLERIGSINMEVYSLIEALALKSDVDIEYEPTFDIKDLLTSLKVTLRPPQGRFAERLIDYIQVNNRVFGYSLYILINVNAFIQTDDYASIDEFVKYENISLLFINGARVPLNIKINEHIIDKDLCEI